MTDKMVKEKCKNLDCEAYPYYGMAPHKHDFSRAKHWVGSTVVMPEKDWPRNFTPSIEARNVQGVWYCPECLSGQEDAENQKLKEKVEAAKKFIDKTLFSDFQKEAVEVLNQLKETA